MTAKYKNPPINELIIGATIKPLIGEDGRSPEPPDPAYQQILKGVPAAGNIQFVIFKQRKGTLPMARIAGIDTKDKILGHLSKELKPNLFILILPQRKNWPACPAQCWPNDALCQGKRPERTTPDLCAGSSHRRGDMAA
jgi:hypothetical protein